MTLDPYPLIRPWATRTVNLRTPTPDRPCDVDGCDWRGTSRQDILRHRRLTHTEMNWDQP